MEPDTSDLAEYISSARQVLAAFEAAVGWNSPESEDVKDEAAESFLCPYDRNHNITKLQMPRHVRSCKWKKLGYSTSEVREILNDEDSVRTDSGQSVSTDAIVSKIAPGAPQIRTDKHYKCHLSSAQRLAIYEEEVRQCYSSDKLLPDKALYMNLEAQAAEKLYQNENPEKLSEVELMQKMRDMKKRRQSYRAKNVHITKRSQTEIIRGVLEVHMEELSRLWNPKPSSTDESNSHKPDSLNYDKIPDSQSCKLDNDICASRSENRKHSSDRGHSSDRRRYNPSTYGDAHSSQFKSHSRPSRRTKDDKAHSISSYSRKEKDVSFHKNYDRHFKSNEGRSRSGTSKRHFAQKESSRHKSKKSKRSHSRD